MPATDASGLKQETALLAAANAALGRRDVQGALSLLDDYDRRPGSGLLAEECADLLREFFAPRRR